MQEDEDSFDEKEAAEKAAQLAQFHKLNDKLNEVRRKQRVKRLLREDLVRNGASSVLAKSYV